MTILPEYSRTGAIAVNNPNLSLEDRRRLRDELIAAESYEELSPWAKAHYDEAYVIYLQRFGSALT